MAEPQVSIPASSRKRPPAQSVDEHIDQLLAELREIRAEIGQIIEDLRAELELMAAEGRP
jgi:hypothetical protein